jgi:hypothetical protein
MMGETFVTAALWKARQDQAWRRDTGCGPAGLDRLDRPVCSAGRCCQAGSAGTYKSVRCGIGRIGHKRSCWMVGLIAPLQAQSRVPLIQPLSKLFPHRGIDWSLT